MSNKLTWVDVAHYYEKNKDLPIVYVLNDGGIHVALTKVFYWAIMPPLATDLPVLRDWDSITDEEAFELLNLAGGRFSVDKVEGAAEVFLADYAYGIDDAECFEMTAPALFWFVSKGFNVFGVKTWKGETK